jgi:hypothetical protein
MTARCELRTWGIADKIGSDEGSVCDILAIDTHDYLHATRIHADPIKSRDNIYIFTDNYGMVFRHDGGERKSGWQLDRRLFFDGAWRMFFGSFVGRCGSRFTDLSQRH